MYVGFVNKTAKFSLLSQLEKRAIKSRVNRTKNRKAIPKQPSLKLLKN
jgi:hypothetical protein